MNKTTLRTLYKQKRNDLDLEEVISLDKLIFEELIRYDWSSIQFLHCYLAIAKFKEYDTLKFIHWIWAKHPHVKIVISRSDFETHELKHFIFDKETELACNAWGIPEPANALEVDVEAIDAVLTPLLVLDKSGNRVGYGKGFYDRFFASCKPTVLKAGISYFQPVDKIDDISEWDVPIDIVFTPGKTFYL